MIANQVTPSGSNEIDDDVTSFLPQWAIAMIVIGFLSLFMVILFGVTVVRSKTLFLLSTNTKSNNFPARQQESVQKEDAL